MSVGGGLVALHFFGHLKRTLELLISVLMKTPTMFYCSFQFGKISQKIDFSFRLIFLKQTYGLLQGVNFHLGCYRFEISRKNSRKPEHVICSCPWVEMKAYQIYSTIELKEATYLIRLLNFVYCPDSGILHC